MTWKHRIRGDEISKHIGPDPRLGGELLERNLADISAYLNANAPDELTAYSPVVAQGGGGIVYGTPRAGVYQRRGPWIEGEFEVVFGVGTAGTAGTAIDLTLPVNALAGADPKACGSFILLDSGLAYYEGSLSLWSTTLMRMYVHNVGGQVGATPNFGLANADRITGSFRYRWR